MVDPRRALQNSSFRQTPGPTGGVGDGYFTAIFETSGEALAIINSAGVIQRVNRPARQLLGMADARSRQRDLADFLSGSGNQQWASLSNAGKPGDGHGLAASLQSGAPVRISLRSILPGSLHLLLCLEADSPADKTAEAAGWRQLDAELRCVLDSVQAGVLL